MKGLLAPLRILSIDPSVTWIFKTLAREDVQTPEPQRCNEEFKILAIFYWHVSVKRYDTGKQTGPLGEHLRLLKEVFNGIDFYCSVNSVKPLSGVLNGFRHMLLNTERKRTLLFLDWIHHRMCALNFKKASWRRAPLYAAAALTFQMMLLLCTVAATYSVCHSPLCGMRFVSHKCDRC